MPLPVLVELMGAPGAGKSTVFAELRAAEPALRPRPVLTRSRAAPLLHADALRMLATLARTRTLDRSWTPNKLAMAAELRTLPRVLPHRPEGEIVVFDQGPLYNLTRDELAHPRLGPWWERTLARWERLLDYVVWLDAPDEVLVERIRTRPKAHRVKDAARADALRWVEADRALHGRVIARAEAAQGGPEVLRYDTGALSAAEVAADVLATVRGR